MKMFLLTIMLLNGLSVSVRKPVDETGYAVNPEQVQTVIAASEKIFSSSVKSGELPESPMIAAILPHDDHLYAGPIYYPVVSRVSAKRILLIGVAHRAEKWKIRDCLIFDEYDEWRGPFGSVRIAKDLRASLAERMPKENIIYSNDFHAQEHSLEAIIPFLNYVDRDIQIVPILIPCMDWERLDLLSGLLARELVTVVKKEQLIPGRDIQILISSDSVHYGDQGWGGKNYAPFGCGVKGLEMAKQRDRELIDRYLLGPISPANLEALMYTLVKRSDVREYQVQWCGRFSIPFGLNFLFKVYREMGMPIPEGYLMGYGTSVELGQLQLEIDKRPGVTAPANLHHWVGYASIGYFSR